MDNNKNNEIIGHEKASTCTTGGCCGQDSNSRRNFIKCFAFGAGALSFPMIPVLPGCFSVDKNGHLIPADKQLSEAWIKSLTERGQPEIYSSKRDELKYIGMPIGGICTGQLYISGDGRLWLWDIFQSNYEREEPANPTATDPMKKWRLDQFSMGGLYAKPRISSTETDRFQVKNGFAVRYTRKGETKIITLDQEGFENISFRGEYPIAKITYEKEDIPFKVSLNSYSPFIPLNVKDSGIPVTIMTYEFTNKESKDLKLDIGGWLENKACQEAAEIVFRRDNKVIKDKDKTTVFMTISGEGLNDRKGYGDMAISLLNDSSSVAAKAILNSKNVKSNVFDEIGDANASVDRKEILVGGLSTTISLQPGESKKVTFLVSWYFPYYNDMTDRSIGKIEGIDNLKRHYAKHYSDANEVATYVAHEFDRLSGTTLTWNRTWYDSTLPFWLLDRSFISLDCLASQTSHLFDNGRFWGWEGVDCCPGTCTHVWQYAQGMAHIFPSLERGLREKVDYGIAYNSKGSISYRGENVDKFTDGSFAIDGQLGTIIRVFREHQISSDNTFLAKIWPNVKHSMQYIIDQDKDGDGLLEGKQPHTLDAAWFGPMGWISGMYLTALKASEQMALEMDDAEFADTCGKIISAGQTNIVKELFNGEYFIHLPPDYESINTNDGCHIDQVLGQSFAYQVNLPNVLPNNETRSALKALWKYNFAPDAGKYALDHKAIKGDRLYVLPGEAGLVMTSWPYSGDEKAVPGMAERPDNSEYWIGPGGYFDECMNGFEYQVASHMVWEGMLTEGLSIMKAVHERYNGAKRNPYDEVECSSHYARSMASYGIYLAACGFSYHGPKGEIGFDPKISPENFKCAFTAAEGWGTFSQVKEPVKQVNTIKLVYGNLNLNKFNLQINNGVSISSIKVNGVATKHFNFSEKTGKVTINVNSLKLISGDRLEVICYTH